MQVSATPVRRGVAVLMSSGGGAWLATGYFLPAFQAETQTLDAMQIDAMQIDAMQIDALPYRILALTRDL